MGGANRPARQARRGAGWAAAVRARDEHEDAGMYTQSILLGRRASGQGPTGPGVGRLAYLAAAKYGALVLFRRPRPGHEYAADIVGPF